MAKATEYAKNQEFMVRKKKEYGGGSARRATVAIVRPKWIFMVMSTIVARESTLTLVVCGPLCI